MADTVLGVIKKSINGNIEDVKETLASNSVEDYAEFKHLRGVIRGLRTALVVVENMEKNLLREEGDDE